MWESLRGGSIEPARVDGESASWSEEQRELVRERFAMLAPGLSLDLEHVSR